MTSYDAVIIGGGPAGSQAGSILSKAGFKTLIIEEDPTIGLPQHCAGLISISGLKKLNLPYTNFYILNKIRGAFFYSPNGTSFEVNRKNPIATVIDRVNFDRYLAKKAQKNGAKLMLSTKALHLKKQNKQLQIKVLNKPDQKQTHINARIVIDAEGRIGIIRRIVGINDKITMLPAYQFVMSNVDILDSHSVELFFNVDLAKDFFIWVIPLSNDIARVGLATAYGNPKKNLKYFIQKSNFSYRFKNAEIISEMGGGVITSGPISKTFANNFLVVGDAAGHVKPTTGGGIILGGLCTKIAAKVAVSALTHNNLSSAYLSNYQRLWKHHFGKEFQSMLLLRKWLNILSNKGYNELFHEIKKHKIYELLSFYGDMDLQYNAIKQVLLRPHFMLRLIYFSFLK